MKQVSVNKLVLRLAPLALAVSCSLSLLSGCSSDSSDAVISSNDASISGTIVAAPVNGADVSVVDGSGNIVAGPVKTNATGQYTLSIPNASLAQDLIVKSTGGTFTDEATGNNGTAGEMYAYASASSLSNGSSVSATPGSAIIASLVMDHGKTMDQAKAAFATAFGYTPDMSVTPADATTAPAADETMESTLAGFRAGAFSQLAKDLGLSQNDQFALFAALAQDLSDDMLDGVDASGAVAIGATGFALEADIQNRFAMALVHFENNTNNLTGLDKNEIGDIPFAKVALTTSYRVDYIPTGSMAPVNGKSTFQIHVTNRNGTDAPGLPTMLMPMMYMPLDHMHSTPMPVPAAVTEDLAGGGLYNVTLYYLMPTAMGGYWDLKFMVDGEEAHFYPTVMMAMGDTAQVRLKGIDDQIMTMTGMAGRTYFMFKESLMSMGGPGKYDFSVFIAAQETMDNFPIVYDGNTLSGNAIDATVEISDDDGATYKLAMDGGNGVWSVNGLTLTDGVEDQIRIRLTINDTVVDEMKTTNGLTREVDVNDFQTFTVTPGMSMQAC